MKITFKKLWLMREVLFYILENLTKNYMYLLLEKNNVWWL